MKKRHWTSEQKLQIVMQGIKGRAVSEICNEYQISQGQYYKWRDQFLTNAGKVFEQAQQSQKEQRLERENERLKKVVGELTLELKCASRAIGKEKTQEKRWSCRCRQRIARKNSSLESRPSVLGLSENMGLLAFC